MKPDSPNRSAAAIAALVAALLLLLRPGGAAAACDPTERSFQCLARAQFDILHINAEPVAPSPLKTDNSLLPGTGLCGAYKKAGNTFLEFPGRDPNGFPGNAADFPRSVNDFIDGNVMAPGDGKVAYQTLQTPFDLSNLYQSAMANASGEYIDTPGCADSYGCPFPGSQGVSATELAGSRFRGFFNVRPEWVNVPIHFGLTSDAGAALIVYAKTAKSVDSTQPIKPYLLISRFPSPPLSGRATNTVIFSKPGLYPIEILHAKMSLVGYLEFVILHDYRDFTDLDQLFTDGPKLNGAVASGNPSTNRLSFSLADTSADSFFQTVSGAPPYSALSKCQQCPRGQANAPNQPPGVYCDNGYFCNEAAVCSPCVGDQFCGKSCSPCDGGAPYCIPKPSDPTDAYCVQCRVDSECSLGQFCVDHVCITPNTCCPETPHLVVPDPTKPTVKVCSPCALDADCGDGQKCDVQNTRCVDQIPENSSDSKCGTNGVDCATVSGSRPLCLNGQVCVQCRNDFDCGAGKSCLSGDCVPCLTDRHCGPTCQPCGATLTLNSDGTGANRITTDTPFCYHPDNTVGKAICVRCTDDSQCGPGGSCDSATHDCTNKCATSCGAGLVCNGTDCVQCYSSSQCPCGACIGGSCGSVCQSNTDCKGNECCLTTSGKCASGRCAGTAGGALCGCSLAAATPSPIANNTIDPTSGAAVGPTGPRRMQLAALAILLCGLALYRRRRPLLGRDQR